MNSFNSLNPKHTFQQDFEDQMLPFTFDLMQSELVYIDSCKDFALLEKFMRESVMLGIDTETRPSFYCRKKSEGPNRTSIVQIAVRTSKGKETTFIIDLLHMSSNAGTMTRLDSILTPALLDEKCLKIGQGLDRDFREMSTSYPHMQCFKAVRSVVEMTVFVKRLEPELTQLVSLKYLVKRYLNCNLLKTQQTSDWARRPLTPHQIHYAACDALVLLRLYDAMLCELQCGAVDYNFSDGDSTSEEDVAGRTMQQRGVSADSQEPEPFYIASVLSEIDTTRPLISKKRSYNSISSADDSGATELVSQYTKGWNSTAAREWYASQLLPATASTATTGAAAGKKTKKVKACTDSDGFFIDDGEAADSTSVEPDDASEATEEDIHIPLPVGKGAHKYL